MVNETATKQAKGIDGTLRVFEAFAGYGSQRMALNNLGIKHEVVATSEVDEYAILSYGAIHGSDLDKELPESEEVIKEYLTKLNVPLTDKGKLKNLSGKRLRRFYNALEQSNGLGDISKIDVKDIPDHDLFTYSFPCQDISVAGNQKGFSKDSETRSGLLWESERIIKAKKPKYLLMENVKNLVSKKFMPGFLEWISALEELGYSNYWEVLNAKDFGIPQNRERVFMVSILGEHEPYVFPKPIKLEKRLKDVLEDEVDEKYYLDNERAQQLIATITDVKDIEQQEGLKMNRSEVSGKSDIAQTLLARDYKGFGNQDMNGVIEPERMLGIFDKENSKHQSGSVYNKGKIAPTLDTMQGGWRQPSIIDEPKIVDALYNNRPPRVYSETSPTLRSERHGLDVFEPKICQKVGDRGTSNYSIKEISNTIPANPMSDRGQLLLEPKIAASRGRNPENPSDRTKGAPTEQRLEVNDEGTSNTLTTVQKDNYVLEGVEEVIYFYAKDNVLIDSITLENNFNNILPFEEDYVYVEPYIVEDEDTLIIINESVGQGERIRREGDIWVSEEVIHDNDYLDSLINKAKPKKEYGRMGRQAVETLNENDVKHGDTINPFNKQVSSKDGISPTLTTRPEGFKTAVLPVVEGIPIKNNTEQGYLIAKEGDGVDLAYPTSNTRRGRVQESMSQTLTTDDSKGVVEQFDKNNVKGTLYANVSERFQRGIYPLSRTLKASNHDVSVTDGYRIRKLTPLECFRLMDVTDEDFYKAQAVNSNSQLYKQAGNSIVVSVLEAIFRNLFLEVPDEDLIGEQVPLFEEGVIE